MTCIVNSQLDAILIFNFGIMSSTGSGQWRALISLVFRIKSAHELTDKVKLSASRESLIKMQMKRSYMTTRRMSWKCCEKETRSWCCHTRRFLHCSDSDFIIASLVLLNYELNFDSNFNRISPRPNDFLHNNFGKKKQVKSFYRLSIKLLHPL